MPRLIIRPAVIPAFPQKVHFLPSILTDVAHPDFSRCRVNAETPWMPKADGIEFAAQGRLIDRCAVEVGNAQERIVRRNAVKGMTAAIGGNAGVRRRFDAPRLFVHVKS